MDKGVPCYHGNSDIGKEAITEGAQSTYQQFSARLQTSSKDSTAYKETQCGYDASSQYASVEGPLSAGDVAESFQFGG